MKNLLTDLQNHLFEMIEKLNDDELIGDALEEEIKRAIAISDLAKVAVTNGALMIKAADTLYGLPVSDALPLIPASPAEKPVIVNKKRDELLAIPKSGKK